MTNNGGFGDGQALREVSLDEILDWAYCPVRYWWEQNASLKGISGGDVGYSGEYLIRKAVTQTVKAYLTLRRNGKTQSLPTTMGFFWKKLLHTYNLSGLGELLSEYAGQYGDAERAFGPKGNIRRKSDGKMHSRPSETGLFRLTLENSGAWERRELIDLRQHEMGLFRHGNIDSDLHRPPTGLADAYAISLLMITNLAKFFENADTIVDTDESVYVDLLGVRLRTRADLVLDVGEAPRRVGRPRNDKGAEDGQRRAYAYEMFLYDAELPAAYELARDLRLMALRQSLPHGTENSVVLDRVVVRHLRTGTAQEFSALEYEGQDVMESLAMAFLKGSRAGLFVPRMVAGWRNCEHCDYRGLCFAGDGVMNSYNPPQTSQILAGQDAYRFIQTLLQDANASDRGALSDAMQAFVKYLYNAPEITLDGLMHLLESLQNENEV